MISRSLGPEFGGSIGLILSLANAISAAMNCVGFTESLLDLFSRYDIKIIDGGLADTRIIGCITITVLLGVVCVGMEWEAKVGHPAATSVKLTFLFHCRPTSESWQYDLIGTGLG